MILAGDVGGTKVWLAYFEGEQCVAEKKFKSKEFGDFPALLKRFLQEAGIPGVKAACFGVAGPVKNNVCHTTNLPWSLDAKELRQMLETPSVFLINDLEANAWGLAALTSQEFCVLNPGIVAHGNQSLISAGTGLGEAGLVWDGVRHHPFACEGGHVDFGPRDDLEIELLLYMKKSYDHVSYERIVSGHGLYMLYRFFVDVKKERENPDIEALKEGEPQREIVNKAMKNECETCIRAVSLFTSLYGSEAGNLSLKFLSIGGTFLGGGIVPNLLSFFQRPEFMQAFVSKGRFASMLKEIPVKVVLNDRTALLGAKRYAQEKGGL